MAKRPERIAKTVKPAKGDRWTVRGVSARLQKSAGDAARARGLTLGQWLSEVLSSSLAARERAPAVGAQTWEQAIERRLVRLEAAVLEESRPPPEPMAAAAGPI